MNMNLIDKLKINPMDWHSSRMLTYIPEHFVRVRFDHHDRRLEVLEWLQTHTVGRFAIEAINDEENSSHRSFMVNEKLQIGFEDPAEATMYTMFFQ
jgi:hypothetical protein